ncbi:TadE family type IV pilus minor pilin [Nocardia aurantia]|uniref:Apoptosis inhibitor n=1 Tax=Nocardia aurantia TaxID=2585199 RepID=A0A7K0DFZ6_9NOCA|nr:TadE family type IV pilus minor pilin [Nocardia aurantia]MQY24461.1 Apoptosis inhibitor [Nocardia aurantia]
MVRRWWGGEDRGAVTVEAAFALAALVSVLTMCLGGLLAASSQVRCVDAAREAARLVARGADDEAVVAARRVAPSGAEITVHVDGDGVSATVTAHTPLLPRLTLRATAFAVREPGAAS